MVEIAPDELRARLEAGESLEVVDIREAGDFAGWHIHGSRNLPVYDALRNNRDDVLLERADGLPRDRPVVTVCKAGIMSRKAATLLASRGIEAWSLSGGIRGWGGVWTEAPIALDRPGTTCLQVRRNGKGCLSYLVGSRGKAAVVDPCVDVEAYVEIARRESLEIVFVLETHVHADHLSRARELCAATGAELVMPPNDRVTFPFRPLHHGESLAVGDVPIRAIATPGHTGESTSYRIGDAVLLSGDTLFVNAVGRPDLERGDAGADAGARALYRSLHTELQALPGDVRLYPGHHNRPIGFDRVPVGAELEQVRSSLELLRAEEQAFVDTVLERLTAKPGNFESIIAINEGREDLGGMDKLELEAGPNSCAAG